MKKKAFVVISILMCTVFFFAQESGNFRAITIFDFAGTQFDNFQPTKSVRVSFLDYSIENQKLYNNKIEISLIARKAHSNKNSYNKPVYTRIRIWQFEFETEEKCTQTIDSLLNCFPNDCAKIQKQVNQGIKITPSIWIFDKKRMLIAETSCTEIDEKWINFQRDFVEKFADSTSEIIVTECGYLTWKTKDEIVNEKP